MKTVLIVEDEKMIRQGLKAMIQRSGVPVEVILECNNGETALETVRENEIDVMFTDIRMPKMDGIELVKHIKECEHIPLVVAISGYDDFSYAVEMLRSGVREYLLKPIEREKITAILQQLEKEITEKNEKNETIQKIGFQQLKYVMMNEHITQEEMEILKKQYESYFYSGGYYVLIAESREREVDKDSCILFKGMEGQDVFLIEENELTSFVEKYLSASCIGISKLHFGIQELQSAYVQAKTERKNAYCRCIVGMPQNGEQGSFGAPPKKLRERAESLLDTSSMLQRVQLIGTDKTEELTRVWNHFFTETRQGRILPEEFEDAMQSFFAEAEKTYRNILGQLNGELEEIKKMWEYDKLLTYEKVCMEWIMELHTYMKEQFDASQNNQKMKEAIQYIELHYSEDINMAVVSNHLSMNYSLFSYSFKKYTGLNFVNYIKNLRMQKARYLLTETDRKIIEISKEVGYDNEKHFMKLFKATFGVSPSEYRKNMQS